MPTPDPSFEELMERLWMPADGEIDRLRERTERMERRARWSRRRAQLFARLNRRSTER